MREADEPMKRLTGSCLCGRLAYSVADSFAYALYCHCSLCRRTTGSAFKALAGIESDKLELTCGADDAVLTYGESAYHNINCRYCGSLLYAMVRGGAYVHVAMGTLMEAPAIRPSMHIFVGSKAPWYEITDGLPQHEGFAPE